MLRVYKAKDGYRWQVKAANGEIVASGEGFTRKEDALRAFKAATRAMLDAFIALPGRVIGQKARRR